MYTVVAMPFNPLAHGFAIGGMQTHLAQEHYGYLEMAVPPGSDFNSQALILIYDNLGTTSTTSPMQPYRTFAFESVTIDGQAHRLKTVDALAI